MDVPQPVAQPEPAQDSLTATLPRFQKAVHVGDRVRDKHSKREGVCLYIGPANFSKGKVVCGLRLDRMRTTTDCDGKFQGERYCAHNHQGFLFSPELAPPLTRQLALSYAHQSHSRTRMLE